MIILVDVDGVCCDILTEWLKRYRREWHDTLTPEDIDRWDFSTQVKPECGKKIYDYLNDPTLYNDVLPIPWAKASLAYLREQGHRVVFVTSTNMHQSGKKLLWLHRWGFLPNLKFGTLSPDYIEAFDKSLICGDVLIDDHAGNLATFPGRTILFNQPHNRNAQGYERAADWEAVIKMIEG